MEAGEEMEQGHGTSRGSLGVTVVAVVLGGHRSSDKHVRPRCHKGVSTNDDSLHT